MPKRLAPLFLFLLYALGGVVTIWISARLRMEPALYIQGRAPLWQAIVAVAAAMVFFFVLIKRIQSRLFWEIVFALAVYCGIWFMCLILFPLELATVLAAALTALPFIVPRVVLHDLAMLLGTIGVAVNLAPALSPTAQVILLAGLTVYDMVVARPNGPLIDVVRRLIKNRVIPGLLVPSSWRGWWLRLDAPMESHAAILGSGDLILPLTLVARVAFSSPAFAALVLVGTLSGLFFLVRQRDAHPRAALPWLATGAIIPFLILYLFRYFV